MTAPKATGQLHPNLIQRLVGEMYRTLSRSALIGRSPLRPALPDLLREREGEVTAVRATISSWRGARADRDRRIPPSSSSRRC